MIESIRHKFKLVATNPAMGKPMPELGARIRTTITGHYLALCEEQDNMIVVLRVIHGARDSGTWLS